MEYLSRILSHIELQNLIVVKIGSLIKQGKNEFRLVDFNTMSSVRSRKDSRIQIV